MKAISVLLPLVCVQLALKAATVKGQDCIVADGENSLPSFGDPGNGAPRIEINPIQVIIKSYRFQCCGRLGGWAAYIEQGGGGHRDVYTMKFQIWRQDGDNPNQYIKIRESTRAPVNVDSSEINVNAENELLDFQPGDVLGYYLEQSNGNNGGIQFDSSFNSEEFFYETGASAEALQDECRLEIGDGGHLPSSTNRGPIISVSTSTIVDNCPGTFTETSSCPLPSPTPTPEPPGTIDTTAALLATGGTRPLPMFVRPGENNLRFRAHPIQSIITSYQFTGCGVVTEWRAYVERSGGNHLNVYSAKFQVWRPNSPSPVDNDGCYTLVGENDFGTLTFPNVDRSEPARGRLDGVPAVSERISFQPGDVIGFYFDSTRDNDNGIMFAEDDDNDPVYMSEEVWSVTETTPVYNVGDSCPLPVGQERSLTSFTNRAPLITVSIMTSACPTTTSVAMTTTMVPSSSFPQLSSSPVAMTTTMVPSSSSPEPASSPVAMTTEMPQAPHVSTPCPVTSTPVLMASAVPTVVPPVDNTESTTDGNTNPGNPTTTESGGPQEPASGEPNPIVIAFVVVLLVVVFISVLTIILIIVVMRRKQRKKGEADMNATALSNPSYEEPIVSTSKSSKSSKKKSKPKAVSLTVNGDPGDSCVYESVEGEYHGMPALDYTYPTPSPTAVKFDAKSENVFIQDKGAYHDEGPAAGNQYDYCGSGYQELEESAVVYEDPTLPKFRNKTTEEDPFDVYGTYVPTLAERQAMGPHYELSEAEYSAYNKLQFFVEDQIYWAPADTASDLYQQLASKKYREIPRNQLNILEELGSGQFGTVCKCLWSISDNSLELAVKTLKPSAPEEDKVKFLQEAAIMGQFLHPNVVKLYGVVTVGEPAMICLEIMSNGDLRSYLRDFNVQAKGFKDTQILFLRFAKEIAAGMNYLSSKAFVHRDLAARNVLVSENLTCKIGDFGMARDLMDDTYYTSKGGKIPVKWTSPEALLYKKYSTDSDVWSYGMVLFEIWSVGQKPFSMHTNNEVLKLIQSGYVQCPPPGTPRQIYSLMVECWNPEHGLRPKFAAIYAQLSGQASKLLYWSPQDSQLSPGAGDLGSSLENGYKLHNDLTLKYKKK